jgi:glycolate oxidase FAD binding subunit
MSDSIVQEWSQTIAAANAKKSALQITGSGSKSFYGEQSFAGAPLSTLAYAGVIDYEPTELVLTARCGTSLSEIETVLSKHQQMLGFEPPHFGPGATLAGCVASGLSGPRRQAAGSARDFVLGTQMINAQGQIINFGGRVMKNVAGYDVSRLLTGSLGTLGLITEISIKVLPKPLAEQTVVLEYTEAQSLKHMNQWGAEPMAISATAWHEHHLHVRFSGAPFALSYAHREIGGTTIAPDQADLFWLQLREQQSPWFTRARAPAMRLWRFSLPSVAPAIELGTDQLIEWGGSLRWLFSDLTATQIRNRARALGGTATLFRGPSASADGSRLHPLSDSVAQIHRKLKLQFDPHHIFNPHRLYPEL